MTAPAVKRPNRPQPPAASATKPSPTAKKAAPAQEAAPKKAVDPLKAKIKELPCLCGCGQATRTPEAKFIPGHDAKLKSLLLKVERGEAKKSEIPEVAKPYLQKSGMSGAYSFPTESGNTPDEDKFGVPFADRKEQVEQEKAAKQAEKKAKLAALKKSKAKKAAPVEDDEEEEEEEEEEE